MVTRPLLPSAAVRRATSTELPMAMRFRHLEKTSKEAVGVYRYVCPERRDVQVKARRMKVHLCALDL